MLKRLYAGDDGIARFEDWKLEFGPEVPGDLSAAAPLRASAAMVVRTTGPGGHPEQPEAGRRLVVMLSGHCDVITSTETVSAKPGDVLLVEDTTGFGHSSHTSTGFEALMVVLD
ncbi:hypothetical protein AB0L70_38850 [Kribbella sp. NPDC051952]|uniref:hypothetical protein n=1 Tax=Kribbella sp. NPDC051952 TaxID=3154851 RepID=UPI00343933DC